MAPFEALYGRRCRTPLNWSEPSERVTFGPDLVTQAKKQVKSIHKNQKRAQSRQKSYSDTRRRPLVFEKGDHVYLRVSPMKGVHRFGVKGKLAPRYVGPFQIIERCGPVAYRLELPPHLVAVHDVFHVSQLKKCLRVPEEAVDTSQIQVEPDLTYEEKPIKILDQKQRSKRRRTIIFYKVQWSNYSEEEATWEQEEYLQTKAMGLVKAFPGLSHCSRCRPSTDRGPMDLEGACSRGRADLVHRGNAPKAAILRGLGGGVLTLGTGQIEVGAYVRMPGDGSTTLGLPDGLPGSAELVPRSGDLGPGSGDHTLVGRPVVVVGRPGFLAHCFPPCHIVSACSFLYGFEYEGFLHTTFIHNSRN
ncbi:hypothetical protein U9M48_042954 [Paspalum notatum var. saurae]|uniref:Chromo domain-containing protein n=1 Tax=Paspalum notatum var. saurae TaxID=547442 RepID=A0AAQ3UTM7_PASNO